MIYLASDLIMRLGEAVEENNDAEGGDNTRVMIDVAGRWTNIKGVDLDEATGTVFIRTED